MKDSNQMEIPIVTHDALLKLQLALLRLLTVLNRLPTRRVWCVFEVTLSGWCSGWFVRGKLHLVPRVKFSIKRITAP